MKKKYYLTTMMFLLMALAMAAQPQKQYDFHLVNKTMKDKKFSVSNLNMKKDKENYNKIQTKYNDNSTSVKNQLDNDTVELKIFFNYDTIRYDIQSLMVYNNDFSALSHPHDYIANDQAIKSAKIRLPKGEYDIYTSSYLRDGTSDIPIFHIKENVNVIQNTEIVIDITDSNNLFSFDLFTLNGDTVTFDKINWIDEEPWQIIESYGNVAVASWLAGLVLDGYGLVASELFGGSFLEGDHYPGFFYINDLSTRYYFSYRGLILDKQGNWYADNLCVNNTQELPLHNNPQNYIPYTEEIKPSTSHGNSCDIHSVYMPLYDNGVAYTVLSIDNYLPDNGIVYLNIPECNNHNYNLNATVNFAIQDSVVESYQEWYYIDENGERVEGVDTLRTYYNLVGPEVMVNNCSQMSYLINSSPAYSRLSYDQYVSRYPDASVFSFDIEKKNSKIGNNCPINVVTKALSQYAHHYIGNFGENRNTDLIDEKLVVFYNDSLIYNGFNKLDSLRFALLNDLPGGQLHITLQNENVRVDNINGFNKTEMFFDQTRNDVEPPSIQMLQFRNTAGFVTNQFSNPLEGLLFVSGADYEQVVEIAPLGPFGEEVHWTWNKFQPVSLDVLYAPYGTEEWQTLEGIEHESEFDDIPGMGFFYSGSLASVSVPSENKWYDLKFRLVDESGNWQEQTVSPAFKIESLTPDAITEVINGDATEVARYSVDGRRITSPEPGVNIVVMSDGTTRKVLVK